MAPGWLNPDAKAEMVGGAEGGLESITGILNVPALALTLSLSFRNCTVDIRRRSSRASNDARRLNARERLRRAPDRVSRRECCMEENQDARVMPHSPVNEVRGLIVRRNTERPQLRDKVARCGLVHGDARRPARAAHALRSSVSRRGLLAEPGLALLLRKTVRETPADYPTKFRSFVRRSDRLLGCSMLRDGALGVAGTIAQNRLGAGWRPADESDI